MKWIGYAGAVIKRKRLMTDKVTGDNIYKALICFEDFYDKMDDSELREFMTVCLLSKTGVLRK